MEVRNAISVMKREIRRLGRTVTKALAHHLCISCLTRKQEVEIGVLREREKNLDRNLTSVKLGFGAI